MKLCIPVATNDGVNSKIYDHFGSAPYFLIFNTDSGSFETIKNNNEHHAHGHCQPLQLLANQNIDAVVSKGMGVRAVSKLNSVGIKTYRVEAENVEKILNPFTVDDMQELTSGNACDEHSCH